MKKIIVIALAAMAVLAADGFMEKSEADTTTDSTITDTTITETTITDNCVAVPFGTGARVIVQYPDGNIYEFIGSDYDIADNRITVFFDKDF